MGVDEGAGPQAKLWATGITAGPANEADQQVAFTVAVDNPGLFTLGGQPTVDPDGVLLFTPKPFASGTATVSVACKGRRWHRERRSRHDERHVHDHRHSREPAAEVHRRRERVGAGGQRSAVEPVGHLDRCGRPGRERPDGHALGGQRQPVAVRGSACARQQRSSHLHACGGRERLGDRHRHGRGRRRHRRRRPRHDERHVHDHRRER